MGRDIFRKFQNLAIGFPDRLIKVCVTNRSPVYAIHQELFVYRKGDRMLNCNIHIEDYLLVLRTLSPITMELTVAF